MFLYRIFSHHVYSITQFFDLSSIIFGVMEWNRTTINGFADHRLTTRPPSQIYFLADHRGFEPLLSDLESDVLPLTLMACGRDDRARTCDLMLPKHVRYQLRYIPSSLSGTRNYLWSDFQQSTLHHYSGEISLPYRSWDST